MVALATVWVSYAVAVNAPVTNFDNETREWWFIPTSGGYEKLGVRVTFNSIVENRKVYYETPLACTVSLIVHRKDTEPSVMNVKPCPACAPNIWIPATNSSPADLRFSIGTRWSRGSILERVWTLPPRNFKPKLTKSMDCSKRVPRMRRAAHSAGIREFGNRQPAGFWGGGFQGGEHAFLRRGVQFFTPLGFDHGHGVALLGRNVLGNEASLRCRLG